MLFVPIKFKTHVQLFPAEMDATFQERLLNKIREEYEGICSRFGYIKPNSIEIIKRSCACLQKAYFNGSIRFDVLCRGEVCNPVQGSIVEAIVKNKNQLGILAESYVELDDQKLPILDIIVPIKSAGILSDINLDQLQLGEIIHIEVMGKKYQMKDRKISIIGRAVQPVKEAVEAVATEDEEVEEGLEEEVFEDLPSDGVEEEDKEEAEKKGGAEDEESEAESNDDEDDESDAEEEYSNDFDEEDFEGGDEEFDEVAGGFNDED